VGILEPAHQRTGHLLKPGRSFCLGLTVINARLPNTWRTSQALVSFTH
jgi:hypothetical protein